MANVQSIPIDSTERDELQARWAELAEPAREHFGIPKDSHFVEFPHSREQLVEKIREREQIKREDAEKRVDEFLRTQGVTVQNKKASTGTAPGETKEAGGIERAVTEAVPKAPPGEPARSTSSKRSY